jgi:tetratricopeptide (TPR) repeat protein
MKDTARSQGVLPDSIGKALSRNNSKAYNLITIIILISLIAMAAYLVSDILSFGPDSAHGGAFSALGMLFGGKNVSSENWQEKGLELLEQGRYNESIECFDKALSMNSSDTRALIGKGKALYALGSYDEAIKCYDKALMINSSDGEALYNKGLALSAMKRYGEAEEAFDKAEGFGVGPSPMHSSNGTNNASAKSDKIGDQASAGSKTPKITPIIVDWAAASSQEHSSVDEGYSRSKATAKPKETAKPITDVEKVNSSSSNASDSLINISNNLLSSGSAINPTENVSSDILINTSALGNASSSINASTFNNAGAMENADASENVSILDNASAPDNLSDSQPADSQSLTDNPTPISSKVPDKNVKSLRTPKRPAVPKTRSQKQSGSQTTKSQNRVGSQTIQDGTKSKDKAGIAPSSAPAKQKTSTDNQMAAGKKTPKPPKRPAKPRSIASK